jgi:hypothetical protein
MNKKDLEMGKAIKETNKTMSQNLRQVIEETQEEIIEGKEMMVEIKKETEI